MPFYLVQLSYTAEAVAHSVSHPQNHIEAVRPAFEEAGVAIRDSWLAFGDYDVTLVVDGN